jgi:hypothetical protein
VATERQVLDGRIFAHGQVDLREEGGHLVQSVSVSSSMAASDD